MRRHDKYDFDDYYDHNPSMSTEAKVALGLAAVVGVGFFLFRSSTASAGELPTKVGPDKLPPEGTVSKAALLPGQSAFVISDASTGSIQPIVDAMNNEGFKVAHNSFSPVTFDTGGPSAAEAKAFNAQLTNDIGLALVAFSVDPTTQNPNIDLNAVGQLKVPVAVILSPAQFDENVRAVFIGKRKQGQKIFGIRVPAEKSTGSTS